MKLTANFKACRGGSSRTMYMGEKEDEFVPVSEKQGQQKSRLNDFKSKARSSSSCTACITNNLKEMLAFESYLNRLGLIIFEIIKEYKIKLLEYLNDKIKFGCF